MRSPDVEQTPEPFEPPDWFPRAACRDQDTEAWFPPEGWGDKESSSGDAARIVCAGCPVSPECLAFGLEEPAGIWGGYGTRDRRAIRLGRRPQAPPPFDGTGRAFVAAALHLQGDEPYSSQTANTTTEKEHAMAARKTTTKKATTTKATTKAAPAATDTGTTRAASSVERDGTAKCPACRKSLPVTKFPTRRNAEGEYERDTAECRSCRDARRAAKKAAKGEAA